MAIHSMTGFARRSAAVAGFEVSLEITSVNARGRDIRTRLPSGLDGLSLGIRKRLANRLARGSVTVSASLTPRDASAGLRIDEARLTRLIETARRFESEAGVGPARLDGLLRVPGVVTSEAGPETEEARSALETGALELVDSALDDLLADRAREGGELAGAIGAHLDRIAALIAEAREQEAARLPAIRRRISARLDELLAGQKLDSERFEQEVTALALKQDIREELDRLEAHLGEARKLVEEGGAIGRRLDFLAQELNREANTVCSKSGDSALTQTGLALKGAIDQLREQCQNLE